MSQPEEPLPPPAVQEVFVDHWRFSSGDPVPGWLGHTEGVSRLYFTVDVTIHTDLTGKLWVVPDIPAECPIHVVGYGPGTKAKVIARTPFQVLQRPLVDVLAYLRLPQ